VAQAIAGAAATSARGLSAALLDVAQPLSKERQDVAVVECVENHPAAPPAAYDARAAQEAELVGDGGLGQSELRGEIADAEFSAGKGVEHSHARRVAQDAKDPGERLDIVAF
jgi:hypothetical protein